MVAFGFHSRWKYVRHKFPVQLYFHPEVRTHAPYYVRRLPMHAVSLHVCALCNTLPPIHTYAYDTGQSLRDN